MKSFRSSSNFVPAEEPQFAEMIVLDANIPIRAIMGRRVRQLLEQYAGPKLRFCAPDIAYLDAETYLPGLLSKRGKSSVDLRPSLEYLRFLVEPVDRETYSPFENEARERLRGRDEEDWPVLATSLAFQCPIWTEDTDFFGIGVAVWTSNRIEIYLKGQTRPSELGEQ